MRSCPRTCTSPDVGRPRRGGAPATREAFAFSRRARRTPRAPRVGLLLGIALALACACKDTSPPTGDAPSPRLVSLAPAITGIVAALEREDHLVGVTRPSPVEGPPIVGDMRPDPAAVLAREPDVVAVGDYPSQRPTRDALEALGANVEIVPLVTLDDMRAATTRLGALLDAEARAASLNARLDAALARAEARAETRGDLRVLWVFAVEQGYVYTTGGGDHLAELLAASGAINVAAGGPVSTRLPLEAVVAAKPDVILHAAPSGRFPDTAGARAFWDHLEDIPAVERGQVHVWPNDRFAQNGPHLAAALDALGDLLDRAAAP